MGDFNVNLLDPSHFLFDELSDLRASFGLDQHVSKPTWFGHGKPSLLDHIYTNDDTVISDVQYLSPIGACHHAILQFSVDFNPNYSKSVRRLVWKYADGDWDKANSLISTFQVDPNVDVDSAWKCFL